ncbi:hypothetical protein Thiowin_02910 [Thiorhodovibrio winogradskyi]|uniref:Uncharacterized protein n=1 Tax=Thiorhodovibrio winogradskyi TaxID=77007 RepID=A0ABZ0SB46_9GAMM|nr:DUF6516 family protein [Thiorhodovibrio winogradskyi]
MAARQILRDRKLFTGGLIIERVVWALPERSPDFPHGLKYRLYCGRRGQGSGECLVRYDNERGKGDHVHRGDHEEPYRFISLPRLLADFSADVAAFLEGQS